MKIRLTLAAGILATIYHAPLQAQTAPEVYTLTVSTQDLAIIGQALGEIPFKQAAPLVKKLDEQIAQQREEKKLKDTQKLEGK